jgi:hypothetical protein
MIAMAGFKKAAGVRKLFKPSFITGFPTADDAKERHRQTFAFLPSRLSFSPLLLRCPLSAGSMSSCSSVWRLASES